MWRHPFGSVGLPSVAYSLYGCSPPAPLPPAPIPYGNLLTDLTNKIQPEPTLASYPNSKKNRILYYMNVSTTKYYFALNFYKTANKSIKILQFIYISYILELSLHFIISKYCYYEKFYTSSQAHRFKFPFLWLIIGVMSFGCIQFQSKQLYRE